MQKNPPNQIIGKTLEIEENLLETNCGINHIQMVT